MIPSTFSYQRAGSVEEALSLAAERGDDAKFLAGGHSLLPLMKLRLAAPEVIIDLGALHDLSYVNDQGSYVAIGALTRHHDVEHSDVLAREVPLLAHAAGQVGDPQIRHRGTIGGSIAHADPASDLPAVLLALDATLVARGPGGSREIPIGEFFLLDELADACATEGRYEFLLTSAPLNIPNGVGSTGNAGYSGTARSSLTSDSSIASTAEVSPMFACSPTSAPRYSASSAGGSASQ